MSAVAEYMAGQTVLVTGATGFLGKVFIEKLLRSCPDLGCLLLLVRSRKGLTPKERWSKATCLPLFDKLRDINPNAFEKVILIDCDISKKGLGLSEADKKLLIATTTLIYHVGASVRFDNSVIDSLRDNTRSTYDLLEMAKEMNLLKGFVYVSTAYVNLNRPSSEWLEEVYPSDHDWRDVLKVLESEPNSLNCLQDKLIGNHPNTYTFSKNLAENIAMEYSHLYPVIIFRPSLVSGVTEDPLPGWADSLTALSAISLSITLGITRTIAAEADDYQDVMPADKVANGLLAAAWVAHKRETKSGLSVYNCASGNDINYTYEDLGRVITLDIFVPSKYMVWPPVFRTQSNTALYFFTVFLKMVIPFYILDGICVLSGQKPRLAKIVKKIVGVHRVSSLFLHRQFAFPKDNYRTLQGQLEGNDQKEFNMNYSVESATMEVNKNYIGLLKYFLHEDLCYENIQKNKKRYRKLIILQNILKASFCIILTYIVVLNTTEFLLENIFNY